MHPLFFMDIYMCMYATYMRPSGQQSRRLKAIREWTPGPAVSCTPAYLRPGHSLRTRLIQQDHVPSARHQLQGHQGPSGRRRAESARLVVLFPDGTPTPSEIAQQQDLTRRVASFSKQGPQSTRGGWRQTTVTAHCSCIVLLHPMHTQSPPADSGGFAHTSHAAWPWLPCIHRK